MNNIPSLLKYTIPAILVWLSSYAFMPDYTPEQLAERKNKQVIKQCIESISYEDTVSQVQRAIETCRELELIQVITPKVEKPTATGSEIPVPSQWYTKKHSLNLSGSHDYRIYSDRKWASWKNNNPSWLTWWVSNTLKWLWDKSWIKYEKWTYRPKNEWWNYILFSSIEEGLRAKVISIRERWWKANVGHFLTGWWTDHVPLSFSKSKIISELSDEEFAELMIEQLKKESPWIVSQLVKDWILIVE